MSGKNPCMSLRATIRISDVGSNLPRSRLHVEERVLSRSLSTGTGHPIRSESIRTEGFATTTRTPSVGCEKRHELGSSAVHPATSLSQRPSDRPHDWNREMQRALELDHRQSSPTVLDARASTIPDSDAVWS
jgi:hypothetical protein